MPDYEQKISDAKKDIRKYNRNISEMKSDIKNRNSQISTSKTEVKNLEKRLEQVIKIIKYMNGDVNESFSSVNKKASSSQGRFQEIVTQEISRGDISQKFKVQSVSVDANTSNALRALEKEKGKIENDIREINRQIKNLENAVQLINSKMHEFENKIDALERDIRTYRRLS